MPSNHVYSIDKDAHDYLWITTTNGVVRYDGYDFRTFTTADGLPKNDIWSLYTDKKNRVWVQSLSDKIGYIYNGQYYNVPVVGPKKMLYPLQITEYDNGIMFVTRGKIVNNRIVNVLAIEENGVINITDHFYASARAFDKSKFIDLSRRSLDIYTYDTARGIQLLTSCADTFIEQMVNDVKQRLNDVFHHFAIFYAANEYTLSVYDMKNCKGQKLSFYTEKGKKEKIRYEHISNDHIIVITEENIYKLDSTLKIVKQISIADFNNEHGTKIAIDNISYFHDDAVWGEIICTRDNGIYIRNKVPDHFKYNSINLSDYKCISNIQDSIAYWWNSKQKKLLTIREGKISTVLCPDYPADIIQIFPFNTNYSLLSTSNAIYRVNNQNFEIINLAGLVNDKLLFSGKLVEAKHYLSGLTNLHAINNNSFYCIYTSMGLSKVTITNDRVLMEPVVRREYLGMKYNNIRSLIWIYGFDSLFCYNAGKSFRKIADYSFKSLAVENIKNVLLDVKYGNVFLNDGNSISYLDDRLKTTHPLFLNYNFKEARCFLRNGIFIACDKTGIIYCNILGKNKFSLPGYFPNIKNVNYEYIDDACMVDSTLYLKTDKGTFTSNISGNTGAVSFDLQSSTHKLLIGYNNNVTDLSKPTEINIDQSNPKLVFSTISPIGAGALKYKYFLETIDTGWHEINSNELYLPILDAGGTYNLYVTVSDDVWKSNEYKIQLYITPYWYQTTGWKAIFVLAGISFFLGLAVTLIALTRHYTIKSARKRQSMLEIELKGVYAQANPHFIFNTLNSALYFIDKGYNKEAYQHVFKFSKLLRSYLESSRSGFVKIKDEVKNLQNYLDLLQVRFVGLFQYEISMVGGDDLLDLKIPSLLLQPLVENAINHGIVPLEKGGILKIEFLLNSDDSLTCTIEDNGIGREMSVKINKDIPGRKKSQGNVLISELVYIFNKYYKTGIDIKFENKILPATGTIVIVNVSNPNHE